MHMEEQINMTKPIGAYCYYRNTHNNKFLINSSLYELVGTNIVTTV